jgi:hypothetical protein
MSGLWRPPAGYTVRGVRSVRVRRPSSVGSVIERIAIRCRSRLQYLRRLEAIGALWAGGESGAETRTADGVADWAARAVV